MIAYTILTFIFAFTQLLTSCCSEKIQIKLEDYGINQSYDSMFITIQLYISISNCYITTLHIHFNLFVLLFPFSTLTLQPRS